MLNLNIKTVVKRLVGAAATDAVTNPVFLLAFH
jgi:hypothetical protein